MAEIKRMDGSVVEPETAHINPVVEHLLKRLVADNEGGSLAGLVVVEIDRRGRVATDWALEPNGNISMFACIGAVEILKYDIISELQTGVELEPSSLGDDPDADQ